jgi:hypothetical protein
MNPQGRKRDALLGTLDFLIVTALGLIIGLLSNEDAVTSVTLWLSAAFVALLATGAVLVYAGKTASSQDQAPPGPPRIPDDLAPRRAVKSVLFGAVSGMLAGGFLVFLLGPSGPVHATARVTSPPASIIPATSASPPSASVNTPRTGEPVTISAVPADGGTQFGDDVTATVAVSQPLPAGSTYWLIVEFLGGPNMVYKAEGRLPGTQGTSHFSLSIASAAVGSARTIYILEADSEATSALAQNLANPGPSYDGNRTSLPSGVTRISNSVRVVKQVN